ncbi:MAG: hypothetical protein RSB54_00785 [Bacilli bacterium]
MIFTLSMADWAWGVIRQAFLFIDSIGVTFIDNAYNLMVNLANNTIVEEQLKLIVGSITRNAYIIVGIFALFKVAVMLINAIISPEKLTDSKSGVGNVLGRIVITIVLMIVTPMLFTASRTIQSKIMNGNYISRLIIGQNIGHMGESFSPGAKMRDDIIRSMVKPDESLVTPTGALKPICENNDKCSNAVKSWENDASIITISKNIDTYVENDNKESVYVYSYTPFVMLFMGIFVTYVFISFSIDIAVRTFELIALEIISPIFIVTFIDPKSSTSGPFKKWLTACGKTYVSLFIKIAVIAIMILFISKINILMGSIKTTGAGVLGSLISMFAVLIFAKKAPKWIGDMIGVEDGAGLGGLGIGKKLAGAALVGGLANKAINTMAGAGLTAASQMHNARKAAKHNQKVDKLDRKSRAAARAASNLPDGASKPRTYAENLKARAKNAFDKDQIKQGLKNSKQTFKAGSAGILKGITEGAASGYKAKDMNEVRANAKASGKAVLSRFAPDFLPINARISGRINDMSSAKMHGVLGTPDEVEARAIKAAGNKKAQSFYSDNIIDAAGNRNKLLHPGSDKEREEAGYGGICNEQEFYSMRGEKLIKENGGTINHDGTVTDAKGVKHENIAAYGSSDITPAGKADIKSFVQSNGEALAKETIYASQNKDAASKQVNDIAKSLLDVTDKIKKSIGMNNETFDSMKTDLSKIAKMDDETKSIIIQEKADNEVKQKTAKENITRLTNTLDVVNLSNDQREDIKDQIKEQTTILNDANNNINLSNAISVYDNGGDVVVKLTNAKEQAIKTEQDWNKYFDTVSTKVENINSQYADNVKDNPLAVSINGEMKIFGTPGAKLCENAVIEGISRKTIKAKEDAKAAIEAAEKSGENK